MKVDSVRNSDGLFVNVNGFREEAIHFQKYGYFCADPPNSPGWIKYWDEQLRRCKEGHSSGGARITGDHYFYLNFSPIKVAKKLKGSTRSRVAKKVTTLPDFWDGDYNYYHASDIGRYGCTLDEYNALGLEVRIPEEYLEGGKHIIIGKCRRKGYSYKNASKVVNVFNTQRKSLTILGAFLKEYLYPRGTMAMVIEYMDFINEFTAWGKKREYVDKQHHKKASYKETDFKTGVTVQKGYLSEILALTFQNNPDAARGKDAQLVLFEEAGKFPNLKEAYKITEPSLRAGKYITGQILIFGTGGDMESGTRDFADMFYNPDAFELLPFYNIWDGNAEDTECGFFHPLEWNFEGFYDKSGNSDKEGAKSDELARREKILKKSSSTLNYQQHVQEWPFNPSEAFLQVSLNDMPVRELRNHLNKIVRKNLHLKKGQPVYLMYENGRVIAKPDLKGELKPLWNYKPKEKDLTGAPVIFEYPEPNAPFGLYKIGYDPYQQDQSEGVSLGSVLVYKGSMEFSYTYNTIVAEYTGRPETTDEFNRIVMMLAQLYNTSVMHENMIKDVKSYFLRKNALHLLSLQPDRVISKNIKKSSVSRVYGVHMTKELKDAGAKYIKRYLIEERNADENNDILLNLETIFSPGLLEELIMFDMKGNFDRVMAFMMIMFQLEEEEENKIHGKNIMNENAADLLEMINSMYRRNGEYI